MVNKIVEMLQNNTTESTSEGGESNFEAILQRLNANEVSGGWMEKVAAAQTENAVKMISPNELISLSALIAYVAHKIGASEFGVERDLADRFHVANIKFLPSARHDDALRYLVDRVSETVG